MQKGQNFNRPAKGSTIKVEPIKDLKDIKAIKKLLADKPRDLCLFTLGINTNLRASDILNIKVGQVKGLKAGDELEIREKKTGKLKRITLNKAVIGSIQGLLGSGEYKDRDHLFMVREASLQFPRSTDWLNNGVHRSILEVTMARIH